MSAIADRQATVTRNTTETQITIELNLDKVAKPHVDTGLPFLDHMLIALGTHGRFALNVKATGDIHVDPHHLVEDTGIVLGQTIRQALGGFNGIARAGCFAFPMDGTLSIVALDLCGRTNLVWNVSFGPHLVGSLDPNLFREFYKGFADGLKSTIHVHVPVQDNDHHVIEAIFKALARALKQATERLESGEALSTKGMLDTQS
jgi:imidazoleglycerol phosphate dehydratase HisB